MQCIDLLKLSKIPSAILARKSPVIYAVGEAYREQAVYTKPVAGIKPM